LSRLHGVLSSSVRLLGGGGGGRVRLAGVIASATGRTGCGPLALAWAIVGPRGASSSTSDGAGASIVSAGRNFGGRGVSSPSRPESIDWLMKIASDTPDWLARWPNPGSGSGPERRLCGGVFGEGRHSGRHRPPWLALCHA